jgi:GT2 family glycosyltransferase
MHHQGRNAEKMNATTAIVLLNWNGWRDTLECLQSLISLEHASFAVLVVDNASTDGSTAKIKEWLELQQGNPLSFALQPLIQHDEISGFSASLKHRSVTLIQSSSNGGFAAGNNLGLRVALQAQCTHMWLLNTDTTVEPSALTALVDCMKQDAQIGMVGSVLCYFDQPDVIQAVGGVRFNYWRMRGLQIGQGLNKAHVNLPALAKTPLTYVAGASMFISSEFVRDVGLMYEGYFLYFEELDWAIRSSKRWAMATAAHSFVFHKEGGAIGTSSRASRSLLAQYYLTRNGIVFIKRHKPALLVVAFANSMYAGIKLALTGQWQLAHCTLRAIAMGLIGETGVGKIK